MYRLFVIVLIVFLFIGSVQAAPDMDDFKEKVNANPCSLIPTDFATRNIIVGPKYITVVLHKEEGFLSVTKHNMYPTDLTLDFSSNSIEFMKFDDENASRLTLMKDPSMNHMYCSTAWFAKRDPYACKIVEMQAIIAKDSANPDYDLSPMDKIYLQCANSILSLFSNSSQQ